MDVTATRAAATLGLSILCAANTAVAQRLDAAQIARDEHAAIRANLCPAPDAPANPPNMFDTAAQRMAPVKVFDNLYLLGMKTVTAWALTTIATGIILFDAIVPLQRPRRPIVGRACASSASTRPTSST